ncbi:MAG: tRNA pseudouridine(55) synthase TruB [Candidatus Omnitrophica bacterium]|nr:tRNA pseudouridine(55) synthase TruB [Candidatus Omnitrophota bacterium]MCM8793013.1 tRNA pseudouridine(55) synthase TruB [Candidatus Omnitrophota bacterium]
MDGIILIDKPKGFTSHDVVDFVRRRFGIKKVGHGGTLDPEATGVLVILLGKATRIFSYIVEMDKEYRGSFYLGKATDTGDGMGKVIYEEKDGDKLRNFKREDIEKVFHSLTGEVYLTPPMFSALHYQGKRLYELAREGKFIERKPRLAKIYFLKLINFSPPLVDFHISCSRGTYIRSLCEKIEEQLGIPLYLYSLRRLRCGNFLLEDAVDLDTLREIGSLENLVIPLEKICGEGFSWSKQFR